MTPIQDQPVWPGELADPFVLKHEGEYWAYGTSGSTKSALDHDRIFPVLHSKDFLHWEFAGCALEPPAPGRGPGSFWAPEVAARDGRFYLYFSFAGGEGDETQRLHVAVADRPEGPFRIVAPLLPEAGFTIDGHPFRDPADGRWYLFLAMDEFDARPGTGLAVAPLADSMTELAAPPTPVLRPFADWQIYERNRPLYGRRWDAWHTIEGAFVVERDGRYWCFYSGGPWQSPNYGVGCAVADTVLGPYRDPWSAEGPSVLRTLPGEVVGPGHNSAVLGPDDETLHIVYHAWDEGHTARRMFTAPLVWTPDGPRCERFPPRE